MTKLPGKSDSCSAGVNATDPFRSQITLLVPKLKIW
jgi:hypothetical protein